MEALKLIFHLYKKELRCLFRDKEVLLYGVLLPLLLIPTITMVTMEAGLCYLGMTETNETKVAITGDPAGAEYLEQQLQRPGSHIKIVKDTSPQEHLKSGQIDAVIEVKNHQLDLYTMESRDPVSIVKAPIDLALNSACDDSIKKALSAANISRSRARVFNIVTERLGAKPTFAMQATSSKEDDFRLIANLIIAVIFLETMMTAAVATVTPIVSEVEQKTLYTVLMIPGNRLTIAVAKYLAGLSTTLLSAVQFCFSILLAGVAIYCSLRLQLKSGSKLKDALFSTASSQSATNHAITTHPSLTGMAAIQHAPALSSIPSDRIAFIIASDIAYSILALALACAVLFAIAAWSRTLTEGQMMATLPASLLMVLPLAANIPDIELNRIALCIPIMNLFLLMKATAIPPFTVLCIVLETITLIAACITFGDYLSMARNKIETSLPFRWANKG